MNVFKRIVIATLLFIAVPAAHSKDLSGRVGFGFINQFASGVPSLSLKYGMSKDIHWLATFGVDTSSPTRVVAGGKFFKNLFYETSLNFYATLGLAYVSDVQAGIESLAALGAEFFIPGIDSLGLSFEAGIGVGNSRGESIALRTIGQTFLHAGMHFYF